MQTQELILDLINTRHVPDDDDVLADRRAGLWLLAHGATATSLETAPLEAPSVLVRSLDHLRGLREGLRQLALANNAVSADPVVIEKARTALSRLPLRLEFGDTGEPPLLVPSADSDTDAGAQVAARAATAYIAVRAEQRWSRIKACANPNCTYAFVDSSRNRSRRWCDMAGCGNRAKNRAWRARAATTPHAHHDPS